ncbi:MAG: diadenylate cyclase CdaA [Oscillospiraceae bacterium]|nr:diadenylate cyclase CdaA [Oscillospiraceae bacterium]
MTVPAPQPEPETGGKICVISELLQNGWHALSNVMQSIGIVDFLDIALLTYLVFTVFRFVRETRAGQLMKGIALLVAFYFFSSIIGLKALNFITVKVLNAGLIAVIVLFQPELRRALEKFGQTTSKLPRFALGESEEVSDKWKTAIPIICESAEQLSKTTTGALIVIERSTKLGEQILNGTVMKAIPSTELFGNIFYNKTPLHDGAVIMRDGIIWAAACFLPKPQKEELIDKHLGSRHRAAIGMSENSDALVIVVSEETGQISVAQDGVLTRNYTKNSLERLLQLTLLPQDKDAGGILSFRRRRKPASGQVNSSAERKAPAVRKPAQPPAKRPAQTDAQRKEGSDADK